MDRPLVGDVFLGPTPQGFACNVALLNPDFGEFDQPPGATVVDEWVHALGERAEHEVRARLGTDRWARACAAERTTSIESLIDGH